MSITTMIGRTVGHYRILERLGGGGMGVVFKAEDEKLGRMVALKFLPPELTRDDLAKKRFLVEARAAAKLDHPNICTVHEIGESDDGQTFIAMAYYEGESLAVRLERGPLPVEEAARIALAVASGLGKAHEAGIVHRDIKPANIILTVDGGVKIVDFGIAKLGGATLTQGKSSPGTLAYMSPEQLRSEPTRPATDIWATGVVLYEMVSGRRPFGGDDAQVTAHAIAHEAPPPLHDVLPHRPAALDDVLDIALAKSPGDRFASADEMADAIATVVNPDATTSPRHGRRKGRGSRSAAVPWLLAGALAVALAATVLLWLTRERRLANEVQAGTTSIPRLVRLTWENGRESVPDISPDGLTFVYVWRLNPESQPDIYTRRVGGEVSINLTKDNAGFDGTPTFSPDGRSIAFRSDREGGGIFLMGASGESVRRLTDGHGPEWSPDGKTIAFRSRAVAIWGGRGENALWTVDVATGERRKVLDGEASEIHWSPSGARIAFARRGGSSLGGTEICSIPAAGGDPSCIVSGPSVLSLPGFDWHGDWIWFWSATGGPHSLWRVRIEETTGARLGNAELVFRGTGFGGDVSISRDGKRVLFSSFPPHTSTLRYAFDPARGRVIPEPQTVLDGARGLFIYGGPSPDGEWLSTYLVDHDDEEQQDIVLVRTSSGETRRLTDDAFREERMVWAPDGSKLYFCIAPKGTSEVWSIRPDGSGRELVVPAIEGKDVEELVPSPDGRALYVSLGKRWEPNVIDLSRPLEERTPVPMPPMPDNRTFYVARYSRWSPDGSLLLGWQRDDEGKAEATLNTFDPDSQTYSKVAELSRFHLFSWLPDSQRILLMTGGELSIVDRITGAITPAGSAYTFNGHLSLDGRWLYANVEDEQSDIWMLDFGDMVPGPGNDALMEPSP